MRTSNSTRSRLGWCLPLLVTLGGCVLGFRGEAEFAAEHALEQTTELRIDVPDTPLSIVACAADVPDTCPQTLRYDGSWLSVGGSRKDARQVASTPVLQFTRDEGFAVLRAQVPLSVEGLVDLEMGELRLPDDRHLDLRTGVGDVSVVGTEASVVVDVDVGDVDIRGADGGLGVRTGLGSIAVVTSGHAELRTEDGRVQVEQDGLPRDLVVVTGRGDVVVTLAADDDIDLQIRTRGRITVRTPSITTVTSGTLSRRNGNGSVRVELSSPRGDIEVRTVDPG